MTMDVLQLQRQLRELQASMHQEGFIDDQFTQLQRLQDDSSPDFVKEVVTMYFDDSEKLIDNMKKILTQAPVDFKQVDAHVHQFKGSSASIGAARIKNICMKFRNCCENQDHEGCWRLLQQLQNEYSSLKGHLMYLFRLEQELRSAGGKIPSLE
ncbi:histidine-containing phosphotransfer protein 1 [Neltuma alba]|uniref:histidine-containing phosphotransfer protein 1 n=2 Tax=Neltuma alba TaxID=207710 RepID=UPI0010A3A99B|nr:histidine-containing phosphotransfer protein 1-like [Prosopis alba]